MVETYGEHSNPMMRRPIVKAEVLEFMREGQAQLSGNLAVLEEYARKNNIPIIPHETVVYFQFLLPLISPQKILEVGTAIGFSSLLMAEIQKSAEIITLERYEEMIDLAQKNFARFDKRKQIKLVEGEAAEQLPQLSQEFDFIFMDSAKTQYVKFLPHLLSHLRTGGVLVIDDVFQAGDVFLPLAEIPRRQHNIHKGLNRLFETVYSDEKVQASLIPLGDGLLQVRKV